MQVTESYSSGNVKSLRPRILNTDLDAVRRADAIEADRWLSNQVAKADAEPFTEVVTLTPGLAEALMRRNEKNRAIRETNLERIKRDIETGNWQFNGASIVVSRNGLMNDGQHRCRAVIDTNISIKIVMVFGIDRDSRMTLDQGALRSVGNYLAMNGMSNVNVLAATAALVWQWRKYGFVSNHARLKPTKTEVRVLVEHDAQVSESAMFCTMPGVRTLGSTSMFAFAHYAAREASNVIEADAFIKKLIEGTYLKNGDPLLYCRKRLMETKGRSDIQSRAELLFKTWNAYRREERVERIIVNGKTLPKLEA
jgi:hypothetical protein